jgi:hypothetical protein
MITDGVDLKPLIFLIGIGGGITCGLVFCIAYLWGRHRAAPSDPEKKPRATVRVEPTPAPTGTGGEFVHALEAAQRRLESLLARADAAEQKLSNLLAHADAHKPDAYTTAAFLLANGEDADRVARRLHLSPTQVRLIQELRQQMNDKAGDRSAAQEDLVVRMPAQAWTKNGINPADLLALTPNGLRYNGK